MECRYFAVLFMLSVAYCTNEFTLTITNTLKTPTFNASATFQLQGPAYNRTLIRYMERAVLEHNDTFTSFQASFTHPYGYFIQQINGVAGNYSVDQSFWLLQNQTVTYLPTGVSTYIPSNNEHITATLVDGSSNG